MTTAQQDKPNAAVAGAALKGLTAQRKTLPSWLLYDDVGCALYEKITELPEYYLTRAETEIFRTHADAIIARASEGTSRIALAELGAGSATKTEILLRAVVGAQQSCVYLACDIAAESLSAVRKRLPHSVPTVDVRAVVGTHADAGPSIAALADRQVVLFIGSSIGNFTDDEAVRMFSKLRHSLRRDAHLLVGTDLKKDPAVLRAAYDDAQGVTAAFSKNILARLNRELGARFDLAHFEHVAVWNEAASAIEIFLESTRSQRVAIASLDVEVGFAAGERIHTETCTKYDLSRIDAIFEHAGFARTQTFFDADKRFAVHLARVA